MNNNEFYDVIDNEIQQIVDVNKDDSELQNKNIYDHFFEKYEI